VAAATAAMIGLFAEKGLNAWGLPEILMICVPATLAGVVAAAFISMFLGKDLKDDPELISFDFDWDEAFARLATLPRQEEWETYMSIFQVARPGATSAEKWRMMERIFHLY